jgi:TRAP-type C4-dicarboxylate transport system substrate-binding protein
MYATAGLMPGESWDDLDEDDRVAITEVIQENADILAQEWSREEMEREQKKELARLERMRLERANPWIIK